MSVTAEKLKSELARLSVSDRAALAQFLLHSLDETSDADAEAAWDEELERRGAEIENGTAQGEPAEKVFKALRNIFSPDSLEPRWSLPRK